MSLLVTLKRGRKTKTIRVNPLSHRGSRKKGRGWLYRGHFSHPQDMLSLPMRVEVRTKKELRKLLRSPVVKGMHGAVSRSRVNPSHSRLTRAGYKRTGVVGSGAAGRHPWIEYARGGRAMKGEPSSVYRYRKFKTIAERDHALFDNPKSRRNPERADVYVGWIDIWSADHANVKVVLWRRSGTAEDRKLAREYARKEFGKNGQVFLSKNTTDARTAKQRIAAKLASRARRMYPGKSISGDFLPRTNPKRRNPDISGRETKEEYGQRRANETGRKYFMTGMGHVLLDVPGNRGNKKHQDDMGGIVRVFKPKRRRNPRVAKTKIEYVIQGNYGYGWDDENYEDNKIDAKRSLREYRANGPGTYRLIRRRVKKES